MMLPKTYLDRRGRKSNKYVFISYSHRDKGYVFPMLQLLYDAGVDYWYDKELNDGEVWNEEIHEIITSSDCVGTIFFLSENAILSNAICQEVPLKDFVQVEDFDLAQVEDDSSLIADVFEIAFL